MDTVIIEHLACLEVNRLILQEPYRLVSEVQFNDKSPSFDGEILLYNSHEIKKKNLEGAVKVQIKGTTTQKKIKANRRILHNITRNDLEVYKKNGEGVLYLVVLINKNSKKMQTYYNALSPLDIERYLRILKENEQKSISIDFKIVQDGYLEKICKLHLENVDKQPKRFIELSREKIFDKYRIEYNLLEEEMKGFNFFDNVGYVYGIEGNYEFPVEAFMADAIKFENIEQITLEAETLEIRYKITETKNDINLSIEQTLNFSFSKDKKSGNFKMGRLIDLKSYLNSLKVLKFILQHKKLPLSGYKFFASINEKEKFQNIDEEINRYKILSRAFESIGISDVYKFNQKEDLEELFNNIYNTFHEKNYQAINGDPEDENIIRLKLSKYMTLLLFKDDTDNTFYSLFNKQIFNKIAAFLPKTEEEFNPNFDDHYKVSIFSAYKIQDLIELDNFNFEIYRQSFGSNRHDKSLDFNNQIALDLISVYDTRSNIRYLELAKSLLIGLLENHPDDTIIKLNLLQIKKRKDMEFDFGENEFLYGLLDSNDNLQIKFVANVLLELKEFANRLLDKMTDKEKNEIYSWPIFTLYEKI